MLGERQFRFSKYCLYESSVRVPMILSGSWVPEAKRGTVDNRSAELIDLVLTLTKAAGAESNPLLPGLNLLGDQQRAGAFCEFDRKVEGGLFAAPFVMWRKQDWKLILYLPGTLQDAVTSFDEIKEDPNEWHNLYQDELWSIFENEWSRSFLCI